MLPTQAPEVEDSCVGRDAHCYTIYTSGTTGNPKGVPISHWNICNFLAMAEKHYGFQADDRVYQSLTFAFDYSFEEIWVPLLSGARLIPAPNGVSLLGSDLAAFLQQQRITAWCSVPTVLATIEDPLPDLRLLIVSGEACPIELVERWWTPKRRFLNLYGPTEATVSATWKVMQPGERVTIGVPLPTYTAMILSPDRPEVLDVGEEGELALAGIGLADGYLNRDADSHRAFIPDFLALDGNPGGKLYRTGDLARIDEGGEIEYLGRVDTQVKIRGYRIELGEIETAARELSGIGNMVVNPVELEPGQLELAAYFVRPSSDEHFDLAELHASLRDRLPPYMVPTYFEQVDAIPLLPSQKVDRKSLPLPVRPRMLEDTDNYVEPSQGTEAALALHLATILKVERVSAEADFFSDLGANSLTMARYLGGVRKSLGFKQISMKLIYQHASIRKLAGALEKLETATADTQQAPQNGEPVVVSTVQNLVENTAKADRLFTGAKGSQEPSFQQQKGGAEDQPELHQVPQIQYVGFAVLQLLWMLVLGFFSAAIGFEVLNWLLAANGFWDIYVRAAIGSVGLFAGASAALLAVKWLAIGRFKPGPIPLWTFHHLRFWVAETAIRANPLALFVGTPVYNVYLRLLGAKVGKGTLIFAPPPICTDLVTIGRDTVIRKTCELAGYTARNGRLHLGHIEIGSRSYLGEATVMEIDSKLGDDAQLGNRSALHEGQTAASGKVHLGSPAIVGQTDFIRVPVEEVSAYRAWIYVMSQFLFGLLVSAPLVSAFILSVLVQYVPVDALTSGVASDGIATGTLIGSSVVFYLGSIVLAVVSVSVLPKIWNIFFRAQQVHKLFGLQYFLAQRINGSSNNKSLMTLFGDSALVVHYLKAVGYDLANLAQNGSNFGVEQTHHSPFLCKFNKNTFVSDGLHLINMDLSRSSFKLSPISVPNNVYLGNELHYPPGAKIGEDCLVGTKALIPIDGEIRENVGILGSPPFEIPRPKPDANGLDLSSEEGLFEQRLKLKLQSNLITLAWFMFRNWSMVAFALVSGVMLYREFGAQMFDNSLFAGALLSAYGMALLFIRSFYNILYERAANWYRPMKPRVCSLYERAFWDHERFWKLSTDRIRDQAFAGTPIKNLISRCQGVRLGKQVFDNGCKLSRAVSGEGR